jgi:hypothetical protein
MQAGKKSQEDKCSESALAGAVLAGASVEARVAPRVHATPARTFNDAPAGLFNPLKAEVGLAQCVFIGILRMCGFGLGVLLG